MIRCGLIKKLLWLLSTTGLEGDSEIMPPKKKIKSRDSKKYLPTNIYCRTIHNSQKGGSNLSVH